MNSIFYANGRQTYFWGGTRQPQFLGKWKTTTFLYANGRPTTFFAQLKQPLFPRHMEDDLIIKKKRRKVVNFLLNERISQFCTDRITQF